MASNKQTFLHNITILHDTREQESRHILEVLDCLKIKHEEKKLDYGDYSFSIDERDFSLSCLVERKANADELYNNIMPVSYTHLDVYKRQTTC